MKVHRLLFFFGYTAAACVLTAGSDPGRLSYNHDVRPILSENCFQCHGPDAEAREADLRLDIAQEAFKDRDGSIAIVPGDPEESLLIWMIHAEDKEDQMPPPDSNRSLTGEQKKILKRWIGEGASYEKHWAFIPPVKRQPSVKRPNPIDGFVEARLLESGLKPSLEADPKTWLRRLSFDLTGLPPTLEDYQTFEATVRKDGEQAYIQQVEALLDSPGYGERMAVDWMDAARYADTHGFNNDSERSMWRWRDWVIEVFNRNLPYDQFITEQLAGDLLPNPTLDQVIATGFTRNHVISSEGGIIDEEYRVEYVADRVRTMSMAWLGLTAECARCHDHKFDDFSQKDYYQLFAFFNSMVELGEDGRVANAFPTIPSPTPSQRERLDYLERRHRDTSKAKTQYLESVSYDREHLSGLPDYVQQLILEYPQPEWRISSPTEFTDDIFTSSEGTRQSVSGVVGNTLQSEMNHPIGTIQADTIAVEEKSQAWTLAFWIYPSESDVTQAPLVSNAQFDREPSSSRYGFGWDVRLIDGEIELSVALRYPGYSMILRTLGADIHPGEWRHLAIRFEGKPEGEDDHTPASYFSVLVDGIEFRRNVRFDGLMIPPDVSEFVTLIGSDLRSDSTPFSGRIDEVQQFSSALSDAQVQSLFQSEIIPNLVSRQERQTLSPRERDWLSTAVLDQRAGSQWLAVGDAHEEAKRELLKLDREIPTTMIAQERDQKRETFVLNRGHYASPDERVQPGVPETLIAPWPEDAPKNRLGLARWLISEVNPLTARVVVNRFWQQLFGVGLVKTSEDFGVQSEYPSHPDLLDWLAVDFRESGWNVKRLLKQIVLSKTYRQTSRISQELLEMDPENRLLARGPRFRLTAEAIRDQALALSGLLVEEIGGPSVRPYQPEGIYDAIVVGANYPGSYWLDSEGENLYRRGLYTYWKRTLPYPALAAFDVPEREVCTVRRSRTNTPLQALVTMNDPTYIEASRSMAAGILSKVDTSPRDRVRKAFLMSTGRWPDKGETSILLEALSEMKRSFQEDPDAARALLLVGNFIAGDEHEPVELAAYTSLMSLILNLDETLTKG
jgi:hypothetical protein